MRRSAKVQRFLLLGLSGPIIALNIWLLSLVFRYFEHLITVVAIAAILAFLMNYPVRILEQMRVSRTLAVVIVLLIAITILVISGLTLVPILVDQAVQLLKNIPAWLQTSNENLLRFDTWAQQRRLPINLKDFAGRINTNSESQVQSVATQAVGVALGTVSVWRSRLARSDQPATCSNRSTLKHLPKTEFSELFPQSVTPGLIYGWHLNS
jgi:predicted PurR-regulated permease PerM